MKCSWPCFGKETTGNSEIAYWRIFIPRKKTKKKQKLKQDIELILLNGLELLSPPDDLVWLPSPPFSGWQGIHRLAFHKQLTQESYCFQTKWKWENLHFSYRFRIENSLPQCVIFSIHPILLHWLLYTWVMKLYKSCTHSLKGHLSFG